MALPSSSTYPGASLLPGAVDPYWPTLVVQVEFTAGTWTSLPNRVQKITTSRGRQYELATVRAGTLNVTLENYDGALDPTNTASPYYPNVKLMRRIQVLATWSGVTYTLFAGYVERWPQRWGAAGNGQWTDLIAVDILGPMAQQILEPVFYEQMKLTTPRAWFPLDDPRGATMPNSRVSSVPAATIGHNGTSNLSFGATPTAPGITGANMPAWTLSGPHNPGDDYKTGVVVLPSAAQLPATAAWTVFFAVNIAVNSDTTTDQYVFQMTDATSSQELYLTVNGVVGGKLGFTYGRPVGSPSLGTHLSSPAAAVQPIQDGKDHTFAISRAADGVTFKLAVDGVQDTGATFTTSTVIPLSMPRTLLGGRLGQPYEGSYASPIFGSMSQYAVFDGDLIANLGTAGNTLTALDSAYRSALVGQSTDARVTSTAVYIPALKGAAPTIKGAGASTMPAANYKGKTAAAAILEPGVAENGIVYISAAGAVTFAPRTARFNAAPTLTFGELSSELHYQALTQDYDLTRVFNQVSVTQPGGTAATATSASSVSSYGTRPLAVTLDIVSAQQVIDAAAFLLGVYAEPVERIPAMTLNPAADTNLWSAALGTDLNTAIQINRRPLAGVTSAHPYWVESAAFSIDFGAGAFTVTWQLSPANINHYFTLGDATYGVLGATAGNFLSY